MINKLTFEELIKEDAIREIPNTNGKYFASRIGDIFNRLGRKRKTFELRARGGYLTIGILGKTKYVHQLVAETFLGKRPQGMEINHIDCDVRNNKVENLEYVTHRKNVDNVILNRATFGAYKPTPKMQNLENNDFYRWYRI